MRGYDSDGDNGDGQLGDNIFPIGPKINDRYSCIEEFYRACEEQAMARFNKKLNCDVLYTRRYFPSMEKCRYVYVKCNFCEISLSFTQTATDIFAYRLDRNHKHNVMKVCDMKKEDVKIRAQQTKRIEPQRNKNSTSSIALLEQLKKKIDNCQNLSDSMDSFLTVAKEEFYSLQISEEECDDEGYPEFIVAVSPLMIANAIRFGDVLSIQLFNNKYLNKYNVAIICVYDTNVRLLISGLMFFVDFTPDLLATMFQILFQLTGRIPEVIRNCKKRQTIQSVEILKRKFPSISLLHQTNKVILNLRRKLKEKQEVVEEILKIAQLLLVERDIVQAKKLQTKLLNYAKGFNQKVIMDFLDSDNLYMTMPPIFCGFNRSPQQKVADLVKILFEHGVSLPRFLQGICILEKYLSDRIIFNMSFYHSPIEQQLKDEKVAEVRKNTERKVFNRFLDYYMEAMNSFKLIDHGEDQYTVEYKKYNNSLYIADWKCPCQEVQKIGIPCPHLIMCAKEHPTKSYLSMFNQRWIRNIQEAQEILRQSTMRMEF